MKILFVNMKFLKTFPTLPELQFLHTNISSTNIHMNV